MLSAIFFFLSFCSFIFPMQSQQERIRNEQMKDKSATHSYYEVPWSFGPAEHVNDYIDELNRKLSDHHLVASAQINENEKKLIITLKALFLRSTQGLSVHTIEMPLDNEEHSKRATDFIMEQRAEQIAKRGKKLRKFLEKISVRKVKEDWKYIFRLDIIPSVIHNVSRNIGNEIGSILKDILINSYQLFRLRKLMLQDNSELASHVQKIETQKAYIETRKAYIDDYQSALEEISDSLSQTSDEKEIIQLKKQKAALQEKFIQDKLKQTEE